MGVLRVIKYPILYGLKDFGSAYRESKRLARIYDISKRLVKGLGIRSNRLLYKTIGKALIQEVEFRRIALNHASLEGREEDIYEAIKNSLPLDVATKLSKERILTVLRNQRIIYPSKYSKVRRFFDSFSPVKRSRALSTLLKTKEQEQDRLAEVQSKYSALQMQRDNLIKGMEDELTRLQLGHEAYQEIMNAVYRSDPKKDLIGNITDMLNVITRWAWQVIGRSSKSEAAGWLIINYDGKIGRKIRFWKVSAENKDLGKAEIYTLKKAGNHEKVVISEKETTELVSDERGNFITTQEWENLKLREDLVAVQKEDGSRVLYKRTYKSGSELVGQALRGKGKKLAAAFAEKTVALIGKFAHFENASVELTKISPEEAKLKSGEIVPYIVEGSIIKLVSAGSADPDLRQKKIEKGERAQRMIGIGIVEQPLEKSVGNVRISAIKPMANMISDVDNFNVRPQNRFLISIVGVHSYFIRSLIEFDVEGNAVSLGCLEVTNPEVIPAKLSEADRKVLIDQFEMGKIFAGLASTGIMIKTLREEIDRLTLQYLGPQVYQIVKSRDFKKLEGTEVDDATIMFADISGFTDFASRHSAKEVVSLLSQLFSELTPIIISNGGMVDKYIGDAIMADWGVTEKSASDVENAVKTAIEFQKRLQRFDLGMSIGLNTGSLIAGNLGYEGSKIEFSVIGDSVNVAARLQGAAERGQILIGARTFDLLSEDFKTQLVEGFNAYNRDIKTLKKFIVSERPDLSETQVDEMLQVYAGKYQEATVDNIFVPGVTWAKNKGAVPCYYVRWDKHAWRYKYLKEAGLELSKKSSFENQPPNTEEVFSSINAAPEDQKDALLDVYERLIMERHLKKRSTPSSQSSSDNINSK